MSKDELIVKITQLEEEMFVGVNPTRQEKAWCQNALTTFQHMRYMTHFALPEEVLKSYLQDLTLAKQSGRNLIIEKYAHMDNLLQKKREQNEYINYLVNAEGKWFNEVHKEYPHIVDKQTRFFNYAIAELQTYSDKTLELYYYHVLNSSLADINLVRKRYQILYQRLGFEDLAEVEEFAKNKNKGGAN